MEGPGYSMLVGGYKQSGREDGVKVWAKASSSAGQTKRADIFADPSPSAPDVFPNASMVCTLLIKLIRSRKVQSHRGD